MNDEMAFGLRIDDQNSQHVRFTLFANGANCGQLCMSIREYWRFCAILIMGGRCHGHTDVSAMPTSVEEAE